MNGLPRVCRQGPRHRITVAGSRRRGATCQGHYPTRLGREAVNPGRRASIECLNDSWWSGSRSARSGVAAELGRPGGKTTDDTSGMPCYTRIVREHGRDARRPFCRADAVETGPEGFSTSPALGAEPVGAVPAGFLLLRVTSRGSGPRFAGEPPPRRPTRGNRSASSSTEIGQAVAGTATLVPPPAHGLLPGVRRPGSVRWLR